MCSGNEDQAQISESSCCDNPAPVYAAQDRDTSVRDISSKGRIIQGTERPRSSVWGLNGRGHIHLTSKLLWTRLQGKICTLKVHKIENFFGSEFEFYTISLLVILKY
jgi:hypothetical protein